MMSLPAMSFGDRFCFSRKGGIGGSGCVQPKSANSMAASGVVSRNDLVGTGRTISVLFGLNGVKKQAISPPFPPFKACFQLRQVDISLETARRLLMCGSGQSHISVRDR